PAEIPAKREYMYRDVERLARMLGVPIEPPATHPFLPLAALRVTGCVTGTEARWRLVDAIFEATWVRGLQVERLAVLAAIACGAGEDGAVLVEQAGSLESKDRLRHSTEAAIRAGAFGVPTVLADGEIFWGLDSLPLLDRFLGGERAPDGARLEVWRRL